MQVVCLFSRREAFTASMATTTTIKQFSIFYESSSHEFPTTGWTFEPGTAAQQSNPATT
jgi:hypothetical protein